MRASTRDVLRIPRLEWLELKVMELDKASQEGL